MNNFSIKKYIPNSLTLMNLMSGLIALIYVFDENWQMAFFWVCLGVFFDFWDGFAARALNMKSELGLQLDSLADMVTSGVVPGLVMYKLLTSIFENNENFNLAADNYFIALIPYVGFTITLGAAYRLAKFNIDTRQIDSFIGLPTPANALSILSIPIIIATTNSTVIVNLLSNIYVLITICLFSTFIMNANLNLFSLKFKPKMDYKLQLGFLLSSIIIICTFKYSGFPIVILLYITLSILKNIFSKKTKK